MFLHYSIMYRYYGALWYKHFLQVGQTGSGCGLAWFSSLSSEHLCIFNLHDAVYIFKNFITFFTLPFSLVILAHDLVEYLMSSAMTPLVGSSDL